MVRNVCKMLSCTYVVVRANADIDSAVVWYSRLAPCAEQSFNPGQFTKEWKG